METKQALGAVTAVVAVIGLTPLTAAATGTPVPVPEPGSLSLLSTAIVVGIVGYRLIRRR